LLVVAAALELTGAELDAAEVAEAVDAAELAAELPLPVALAEVLAGVLDPPLLCPAAEDRRSGMEMLAMEMLGIEKDRLGMLRPPLLEADADPDEAAALEAAVEETDVVFEYGAVDF
jgi:hypothetical protein